MIFENPINGIRVPRERFPPVPTEEKERSKFITTLLSKLKNSKNGKALQITEKLIKLRERRGAKNQIEALETFKGQDATVAYAWIKEPLDDDASLYSESEDYPVCSDDPISTSESDSDLECDSDLDHNTGLEKYFDSEGLFL